MEIVFTLEQSESTRRVMNKKESTVVFGPQDATFYVKKIGLNFGCVLWSEGNAKYKSL